MSDCPPLERLGVVPYQTAFAAMREAVDHPARREALWLLEHPPVFTQGRAGKPEHVLAPGDIPVVKSDRGGQVTYHGPGQLVLYTLIDLRARSLGIRRYVQLLEQTVIDTLRFYGIAGARKDGAPGVYVNGAKVAALGLRVRDGMTYHGLSLNVTIDLAPFRRINPCGYKDLAVTRLTDLGVPDATVTGVAEPLLSAFAALLPPRDTPAAGEDVP